MESIAEFLVCINLRYSSLTSIIDEIEDEYFNHIILYFSVPKERWGALQSR